VIARSLMNALQYLANHFGPKKVGEKQYIDHVPFIKRFKSQKGKSKTTIRQFVEINELDYTITDKHGNVVDDTIDQYHYTRHKILISIDSMVSAEQLMPLIIEAHTEALNEMIANQQAEASAPNVVPASAPNVVPASAPNVVPASAPNVVPASAPNVVPASAPNANQFDLLELTDDEMFRDTHDNIVEIEVRGVRTEAGILFRSKHIGSYLGMENLSRTVQDTRRTYKEDTHWIKLYQYSSGVVMDPLVWQCHTNNKAAVSSGVITDNESWQCQDSDEAAVSSGVVTKLLGDKLSPNDEAAVSSGVVMDNESRYERDSDKADTLNGIIAPTEKPKSKRIYLTLAGLLKVIFCSTSANENVVCLRDWVIKLVFVHKFGSYTERIDLAETLTPYKKCLTNLSGIYLICIGKVKDLRESMNISDDLYPSSEYATARVYKFGRSSDIMKRLKDHCCDRTGYGKYSKTIAMEWFVVIPKELCSNAESDLNKYFETNQFKFAFNDSLKDHTELIIVKPGDQMKHIKGKYFELVKDFPTETNALIKQMTELKLAKDSEIDNMTIRHESEKKDLKIEYLENLSNLEKQLIIAQKDLESKEKDHKIEMLEMKLQLATK
jgi:hypothetical protein